MGVVRASGPIGDTSQSHQEPIIHTEWQVEQTPLTTTAPRYLGIVILRGDNSSARSPEKSELKQLINTKCLSFL
jgi:hypothetical protein